MCLEKCMCLLCIYGCHIRSPSSMAISGSYIRSDFWLLWKKRCHTLFFKKDATFCRLHLFLSHLLKRMNFYNHHIRSIFKSHFISVTFKFCAVCVALCALEPCSTDSLGTQHCAKFESSTNRMTFEYAPNMMIVKVHPLCNNKHIMFM